MKSEDDMLPDIPQPLGPGDDDPRSPVRLVARVPVARALWTPYVPPSIPTPPGPGDAVGDNPDDAFHFLTPPPPGPGSTASQRQIVRIPKQAPAAAAGEQE